MKSLIKIFLILIIATSFFSISSSFAGDNPPEAQDDGTITVIVTEEIPGANCSCNGNTVDGICYGPSTGFEDYPPAQYKCEIEKGFGSITAMAGAMIKYLTYLVGIGAVLFIVLNGIMYSMSGLDDSMKSKAKERIGKTLMGLIVLLLSGVILNIIAPWIYK